MAQAELKRKLRDAKDAVEAGMRELTNRGTQPPPAFDSARQNLREANDLLNEALADAARTGKVTP